jgi:predicted DCC family thiol-disulfide oxidoreductase YuxK
MSTNSPRAIVVYDGDCGICEASSRWILKHVDEVSVMSHREYGLEYLGSVWLINENGRTEGARAVAQILKMARGRAFIFFGVFIDLPGIRSVAAMVYYLVARNRRHISRLFGLKACALPTAPR